MNYFLLALAILAALIAIRSLAALFAVASGNGHWTAGWAPLANSAIVAFCGSGAAWLFQAAVGG